MSSLKLVVVLVLAAGLAAAAPSMSVFTSIGPDPFGSPATTDLYSLNALTALETSQASYGTAGTPEFYQQTSVFTAGDVTGTGFPSWKGVANPAAPFNTQTGNMLFFGATIKASTGTTFTLADVTFDDNFFGSIGPVRNLSTVPFGDRLVGIDALGNCYGTGVGCLGTGDSSTLLVEVFFSGFGDQFYIANPADLASGLAEINAASQKNGTGTYSVVIGGVTYNGTGQADLLPEPATFAIGGVGLLLFFARRRFAR